MHQGKTTFNTTEIEIYIRTYRSLLKSSGTVNIAQLIDAHIAAKPLLHEKGGTDTIDTSAFIYGLLRLPQVMSNVKKVILGQSLDVFKKHNVIKFSQLKEVEAPGRRRKMYFDGKEILYVYIASVTDVDDLITLLTSFQIEWNKFHEKLRHAKDTESEAKKHLSQDDISKMQKIWGKEYPKFLQAIKYREVSFTVQLLSGSYVEYAKATQRWWDHIENQLKYLNFLSRPLYFVSSNTHSLVNLLLRHVLADEKLLIEYLYKTHDQTLLRLWREINSGDFLANRENFLYYIAKKYGKTHPEYEKRRTHLMTKLGIHVIPSSHYLDIDTQVIEVKKLAGLSLDPRLKLDTKNLGKSDAVIVNIDYPLGWAAYQILTEIGQNVARIKGVYIMGKAATLNGQIGDILLPTTVFDQHTKNLYVFDNSLRASDFETIFKTGAVLSDQKTIAAKGTFLENGDLVKKWYQEGYTIIEMETGPYFNALYEFVFYNRYAENDFISLTNAPFEIGIAHYASDTPYSKAKNLGVRNLSYEGVEPTYAISLAILKKIIERENK
ncbi:hypothetical protein HYW55_01325 [Candidatus Gottesmanbacteria bacterium]|nr:hypothetical protein [Candidatus Gottesmanbacteria bacterium]